MTWKPDICVYHGGCDDGFGAAWVVRKRWGNDVTFVAGAYGGFEWPADLADKNILFVDFSLKRGQMIELANGGLVGAVPKSIVVLDHHKTAESELKQWDCGPVHPFSGERVADHIALAVMEQSYPIVAHFDMEHSGARMAWDFCFPGQCVPSLIMHIEDRDLWRFRLQTTHYVSAALRTYPHDFAVWDDISGNVGRLALEGATILRGHHKNVGEFIRNRYWTDVGGYRVPVVNVPYHYASDTANELLAVEPEAPFAACWFRRGDGVFQFSLRSADDKIDVSQVAAAFGGGGHRNAAGFEIVSWPNGVP